MVNLGRNVNVTQLGRLVQITTLVNTYEAWKAAVTTRRLTQKYGWVGKAFFTEANVGRRSIEHRAESLKFFRPKQKHVRSFERKQLEQSQRRSNETTTCKSQQRHNNGKNASSVETSNVGTSGIIYENTNCNLIQHWQDTIRNLQSDLKRTNAVDMTWIIDQSIWTSANGGEAIKRDEKNHCNRANFVTVRWRNPTINVGTITKLQKRLYPEPTAA